MTNLDKTNINKKNEFKYGLNVPEIEKSVYFTRFGEHCRIEAKNNSLSIDKINFIFQTFDNNNKQTGKIPYYLDTEKALVLANDILSGRLSKIAEAINKKNEKDGVKKTFPTVFTSTGGVSAEKAKRPDGKPLFRKMVIQKGKKWIVSASYGPGKTTETKGFVADGPADLTIRIGLDDESLKTFATKTKIEIQAYRTAQMVTSAMAPMLDKLGVDLNKVKEHFEYELPEKNTSSKVIQDEQTPNESTSGINVDDLNLDELFN